MPVWSLELSMTQAHDSALILIKGAFWIEAKKVRLLRLLSGFNGRDLVTIYADPAFGAAAHR
jgi:hypothetical protein